MKSPTRRRSTASMSVALALTSLVARATLALTTCATCCRLRDMFHMIRLRWRIAAGGDGEGFAGTVVPVRIGGRQPC